MRGIKKLLILLVLITCIDSLLSFDIPGQAYSGNLKSIKPANSNIGAGLSNKTVQKAPGKTKGASEILGKYKKAKAQRRQAILCL